jgi:hypothetical protein
VTSEELEKIRAVAGDFVAGTQYQLSEFTRFRLIPAAPAGTGPLGGAGAEPGTAPPG